MHQGELRPGQFGGTFEGVAHAAFNTEASVHRTLRRHLVGCAVSQHATFTGVRTFGVLTDDGERTPFADRSGHAVKRSVVDIEIETEPHAKQQTTFQDAARDPRVANRRADGPEQDCVETTEFVKCRVVHDEPVTEVARCTELKRSGRDRDA